MIFLECTQKVRTRLGLSGRNFLPAPGTDSPLGNWTLNRIAFGSRWAFLFMSNRSLLSFPLLEGKHKVEMADIPAFFAHGITQLMQMVGVPSEAYASLLKDAEEIAITKATDRSMLASHNAIAADYVQHVEYAGGIDRCNLGEIILAVNETPRARLQWATSLKVTLDLLHRHAA